MDTIGEQPNSQLEIGDDDVRTIARSLNSRWKELAEKWLPVTPENSKFRYSRANEHDYPEQGWKLHLSANLLTACDVLEKVAPFLSRSGVLFKAPVSLEELRRIN